MRLSLICFLLACVVVANGCSNGGAVDTSMGTGGGGGHAAGGAGNGAGGSGSGGSAGNAGAGSGGSAGTTGQGGTTGAAGSGSAGKSGAAGAGGVLGTGSVCPGVQPLSGTQCRTPSDCPGNGYVCTTNPTGVSSACGGYCISPPPHNDCTVDGDCATGHVCLSSVTPCCGKMSTTCALACTATSCAATERCNAAGHCETFPCADGFTCPAGTVCSASTAGADANGCAPQLCTAGYTCATGFQCAVGGTGADGHGCQPQPCSQTGCAINFVCDTTATSGGCSVKKCASDGDCDCGFCVSRSCVSRLSVCVIPPS
jgi:hypothetical protein